MRRRHNDVRGSAISTRPRSSTLSRVALPWVTATRPHRQIVRLAGLLRITVAIVRRPPESRQPTRHTRTSSPRPSAPACDTSLGAAEPHGGCSGRVVSLVAGVIGGQSSPRRRSALSAGRGARRRHRRPRAPQAAAGAVPPVDRGLHSRLPDHRRVARRPGRRRLSRARARRDRRVLRAQGQRGRLGRVRTQPRLRSARRGPPPHCRPPSRRRKARSARSAAGCTT